MDTYTWKTYADLEQYEKAARAIFSRIRANANRRHIPFELTLDEVTKLAHAPCTYCGAYGSNSVTITETEHRYNGIDRKNPKGPYAADNCVTACAFCNSLRGSISWADWTDFVTGVATAHGGTTPFPEEEASDGRESRTYYKRR